MTLSTCQAEYLAISDACQELIQVDEAIKYVLSNSLYPVYIWYDNKLTLDCTQKDSSHKLKSFDKDLEKIVKIL